MMKRRNFLQATLAMAGASLAGCGGPSTESTTGETTTGEPKKLEDGASYFPQSIASGDPHPDSVILWTRVEDAAAQGNITLELEISSAPDFMELISLNGSPSMMVTAEAQFDHCAKVRLAGISPATVYYYRFIYEKGGKYYVSKVGRAKTAPLPTADANVKFAFISCQDYVGRFYNTLARLAKEPLDFVVHLGDYIYETTGDPTFQNTTGRAVTFTDQDAALELTAPGGEKYYAAKSLSNYRELYKIYRSDPALQAVHESFPMIVTWDDHEFSDDCHGATASYLDGRSDETDEERRKAANQAWFEYMPVDYLGDPDFTYDPAAAFPDDIKIWRDFTFGMHLHLVMTDLRSRRVDHIIPEEAFPGAVVLDEAALTDLLGDVPPEARPYVDIDDAQWAQHKAVLQGAATAAGADPSIVTGNVSVLYINSVVAAAGAPDPIDDMTQMTLPRGVAYADVGKLSFFTSIGSRYFAVQWAFNLLAQAAYKASKKSQDVMGSAQESWFLSTMKGSSHTWKVWGNEYCLTPLMIDLTDQAIPDQFKQIFYMNLDSWDGFRDKRSELLDQLSSVPNVVAITGDIHASYAATPIKNGDPTRKIVEFVGSSISSAPFRSLLLSQIKADPVLSAIPGAALLATGIDGFLQGPVNPYMTFADSTKNGFVIVDVSATDFIATYYRIGDKEVGSDRYEDAALDDAFQVATYKTVAGGNDLYQKQDTGKFLKWNPDTLMFE